MWNSKDRPGLERKMQVCKVMRTDELKETEGEDKKEPRTRKRTVVFRD